MKHIEVGHALDKQRYGSVSETARKGGDPEGVQSAALLHEYDLIMDFDLDDPEALTATVETATVGFLAE